MSENTTLPDGEYPCDATVHVKDGMVFVVLNDDFGLRPGTRLPLLRPERALEVDGQVAAIGRRFNGHAII